MTTTPIKRPRGRPRKSPSTGQKKTPKIEAAIASPVGRGQSSGSTGSSALKVNIYPSFGETDKGDGGIRRVIEGQIKHLPKFGIELVDDPEQADVIAYHATVPATFVKRFPQKTFVAICHGLYWNDYQWDNWSIKANVDVMEGLRVADAISTCSEWVANAIRRATSRPVDVIMHGIDTNEWESTETRDYVLWNKTRPDPVCDPEPMNQVAELLPNIKFISTFGRATGNVALTGRLGFDEAKKLVQSAGVYLCTTRETFGIGTLEAMACGVPVVGFKWGGQAEFLEHGIDSWLATPGDIESLARGIEWAFANREIAGMAALRKAQLFTWELACEKYALLFRIAHQKKHRASPRTSIIVTAYNLEKFLPDTLESVRNQTDQDWECIIVDDASPDSCGEIADKYAETDSRFKVIHNQKNCYLAESRNIGIRAARGKYILPLDADDMLTKRAVQLLADAMDADRSIHVAYGAVFFVSEDGKTPSIYGPQWPPGHSSWPYQFAHEQQIQQRNLLPYSSMYRREAWENTGGYRRRCRTAEDAEMWTRFSSYGFRPKMVTTQDTLIYRNRENSMSRTAGGADWTKWFIWSEMPELTPAGAATKEQLPIPSLDPTLISVVIPVGPGHDKILIDAVDSVDGQIFRNWECIVVNDTGHGLETEMPQWVKVINTEGSTGPAHARNVGIRASKGRLFLPLDADDYLEPDALATMYSAFQLTGEVIYSDFWEDPEEAGKMRIYECPDYDANLLKQKGAIHAVTALTPKVYWEQVGGYDENLPAWEDWDFQLLLAEKGICSRRVPYPLFTYRKHTGFRREENVSFFERSKEGILKKWGALWDGRKELMACSSCGKSRTAAPRSGAPRVMSAIRNIGNAEAVMVRYVGMRQGATPYRGNSGTTYWFAANEGPKYILRQDAGLFQRYPSDFEIIDIPPEQEDNSKPQLVATA